MTQIFKFKNRFLDYYIEAYCNPYKMYTLYSLLYNKLNMSIINLLGQWTIKNFELSARKLGKYLNIIATSQTFKKDYPTTDETIILK